jgi:hypothetical protein
MVKILAGGVAAAALFSAAPASAQYYPGYGYPGYGTGGVIGQVINQVLGGGYGNQGYGYGYGQVNSQFVVQQCTSAVQARLHHNYGYGGGYGGYGGYGYNGPSGARVLGISRIEQRSNGGLTVRGVASSGRMASYGYGYAAQAPVDLTFKCKTDFRGRITDIDVDRAATSYGYNNNYSPYNNDYSQYGYRRY